MDADAWDTRYGSTELVWSAGPNMFVEEICADLTPGRAIDLAAGEGRNAIWLAEQGWDVLAVDFSQTGLIKAGQLADRRGVTLATEHADLTTYRPTPGAYDLVLVAYLQLVDDVLAPILERAAAAVAPAGMLLVVGHDLENLERGHGGPPAPDVLTTPAEVVGAIGDRFVVERAEVVERPVETDDGRKIALDTLVVARRLD